MTEADRIAAALAYQEQMPAMLNPNLARQGARGRANMMPPTSIMDERYPAFKRNQEDVEKLMLGVDLVGSAIPLAGPAMKGAKVLGQHAAPQLAQALENYTFKTGMALPVIDTTGLPNKGRDLIRSKADELVDTLNKRGFEATAEYSGSAAGPSAYVTVFDPQTGRGIKYPARISGHSKGAYQSQFVHEISDDPQSTQRFIDLAMEMRAKGPTELMQKQAEAEKAAMQMRYESAQKKIAKGKPLTNSEQEAVKMVERQAGRTFAAPQDEALRLAQERAALPVERGGLGLPPNNTAEQRAAAMGGEDVYHGTTAKKQILNDLKFNLEKDQRQVGGIWTTKDKNYAIWLADKKNKDLANVMQLQLLNAKNSDEFDILKEAIKIADEINAPKPTNALEAQELLSGGYGWDRVVADLLNESKTPNLKITNFNDAYHSNPNEVTTAFVTKDPSLFRLPNAAFDPFRRNAAIAAAMGVAAPDLLAKEKNK